MKNDKQKQDDKQKQFRFDLEEGKENRDCGKELAAGNQQQLLDIARAVAVTIAEKRSFKTADADDVYAELMARGYDTSMLGNAAGSLFPKEWWRDTGERKLSSRVSNHAREIKVWRLK